MPAYPRCFWTMASLCSCAYSCCTERPFGSGSRAWTGRPVGLGAAGQQDVYLPTSLTSKLLFKNNLRCGTAAGQKIIIDVFPPLKEEPEISSQSGGVRKCIECSWADQRVQAEKGACWTNLPGEEGSSEKTDLQA
ncbi:hypothetical protein AOLI_G00285040 [Acnodon oligacanthus]